MVENILSLREQIIKDERGGSPIYRAGTGNEVPTMSIGLEDFYGTTFGLIGELLRHEYEMNDDGATTVVASCLKMFRQSKGEFYRLLRAVNKTGELKIICRADPLCWSDYGEIIDVSFTPNPPPPTPEEIECQRMEDEENEREGRFIAARVMAEKIFPLLTPAERGDILESMNKLNEELTAENV